LIKINNKRQLIEDSGPLGYTDDSIAIISAIHKMLIYRFQLRMRIRSAAEALNAVESKKTTTKGKGKAKDSYAILTAKTTLKRWVKIIMDKVQSTTHYDPTQLFGSFHSFC